MDSGQSAAAACGWRMAEHRKENAMQDERERASERERERVRESGKERQQESARARERERVTSDRLGCDRTAMEVSE
jgi:hypothetical protein